MGFKLKITSLLANYKNGSNLILRGRIYKAKYNM